MFNGEKLKNLRRSKYLLQSDIAKKLNVSTSTVGMWEQGRAQPDSWCIKQLANLFNVTADYLLDNDVKDDKNKELLETISVDLADPINRVLYQKTSELKNERDKKIVLNIIEGLMKGVDEELDKHEQ